MINTYNEYGGDFSLMGDRSLIKQIARELEGQNYGEYDASYYEDLCQPLKSALKRQNESFYNYDDAM